MENVDFARGTKAKKKTETISQEQVTNVYPNAKKLEFILFSSYFHSRKEH